MERRTFLALVPGSLLAAPLAAEAQPAGKVYRVGVLGLGTTTAAMSGPQPQNSYVRALLDELRKLGHEYGKDFVTEPRGAEGRIEHYPGLVDELLRLHVDVIVAVPAAAAALKQATSTVPIVLTGHSDPVKAGLVQSLAHPGGNFTGLSNQESELMGKRLELLKQLDPTTSPVGIIWDRFSSGTWLLADGIARERGWKLLSLEIRNVEELERVFRAAAGAKARTVLVASGVLFAAKSQEVADLATKHRLAAMYIFRFYVDNGGLISYATDLMEVWRRCAVYVDKILKGRKPGDLPVEQPTKFELVINLKTAKALGLKIPPSLLARADQVIE